MTARAPGVAQRRPQVGTPAVGGGPGPAGPAHGHRERELAHEPGQHQQLGRGQLGEVLAREPFRGAGDHPPGGLCLLLRAGFLILVPALGHDLLGRRQLGLVGGAFLGGVHAGGAGRLGQDVARRRAGWFRDIGGPLAAQLGHRLTHAAEHRAEDPVQRLDLRLAGDQGGEGTQVEGAAAGGPGHGDGTRETLATAGVGRHPFGAQGRAEPGGGQGQIVTHHRLPARRSRRHGRSADPRSTSAPLRRSAPPTRCPGRWCPAPGGPGSS